MYYMFDVLILIVVVAISLVSSDDVDAIQGGSGRNCRHGLPMSVSLYGYPSSVEPEARTGSRMYNVLTMYSSSYTMKYNTDLGVYNDGYTGRHI